MKNEDLFGIFQSVYLKIWKIVPKCSSFSLFIACDFDQKVL